MSGRAAEASSDVPAMADVDQDAFVRDAGPSVEVAFLGADLGASTDLATPDVPAFEVPALADGATGCVPWSVASLPEPLVASCPPTAESAACAGGDVGAVVARSTACTNAWGNILLQCAMWNGPAAGEQIVAIEFDNCSDAVDAVVAVACRDRIELSYTSRGTCRSCDGTRSHWRAFTLPLDPRPVIATGRHVEPPCLPPIPQDAAIDDGGAGAVDATEAGGCAQTPISESVAAARFRAYMFATVPNYNPETSFAAQEVTVPGLWDDLQAQLFTGKISVAGEPRPECSFLYRQCKVEPVTGSCGWFGMILSGVSHNGAFYYSWGRGSGIYRSTLGKLTPGAGAWGRTTSIDYFNVGGNGLPNLVVDRQGDRLLVYDAQVTWGKVNEWRNPKLVGTLADLGDRLAVIDENGQELPGGRP